MEEGMQRDSAVTYRTHYELVLGLPEEEQLSVLKAIHDYSFYGKERNLKGYGQLIFNAVKPQIDANNKMYINGKKGGRPKKETDGFENEKPMVINNENQWISEKETDGFENDLGNKKPNENVNVNDNVNVHENVNKKESGAKRFCPPTLEEVRAYCQERNNNIDPEAFISYYNSIGWVVGGKTKMKEWKQAVITWERRQKEKENEKAAVNASSDQADNDAKIRECYVSTRNCYPLDKKPEEGWELFKKLVGGNLKTALNLSEIIGNMASQSYAGKYQLLGLEKDLEVAYEHIRH